jgi:hypothetical protein
MSFNTSILVIPNTQPNTQKEVLIKVVDIFNRLGYSSKQLTDFVSYDDSHKWVSQYVKAISVSFDENNIIFDDYISQLSNPQILLQLSKEVESPIFYATQSETTEMWSYDIFDNGKYFNITKGGEIDFDFGFEEDEISDENAILESPELAPVLEKFIENFKFDSLFDRCYWDFEITQLT